MKKKLTLQAQLILLPILLVNVLVSCTKHKDVQQTQQYTLAKITVHYSMDSDTDYYKVGYTNGRISKLVGKSNDYFEIGYSNNTNHLFSRTHYYSQGSVVRDSCYYDNANEKLTLVQSNWYPYTSVNYASSTYSDNIKTMLYRVDNYNANNNAKIQFDSDGDIISIKFYQGSGTVLLYTVSVFYGTKINKFSEFYRNFELIDPFCNAYNNNSLDSIGVRYPVNIHYGKKCLSSFAVSYQNGTNRTHNVAYNYNDAGYITKILIDNKPFMSYEYSAQ